jgi:hypothetical protein
MAAFQIPARGNQLWVGCRSVTMSRVILPTSARAGRAADSSSDSNTGGSRRPTTSRSGGGVQVRNAYERL